MNSGGRINNARLKTHLFRGLAHFPYLKKASNVATSVSGTKEDAPGLTAFVAEEADSFAIAILGDLHLPDPIPDIFSKSRCQLLDALNGDTNGSNVAKRVIQLGDLGSYQHGPGGRNCFARGKAYLEGFKLPHAMVLGNHDLEGEEFESDEENLKAWRQTFKHRHYWSVDVGPATVIGLSTTRFRSNPYSVHEVYVDDEQLDFFKSKLEELKERPIIVCTHAPIQGSGLKVVQTVHVKNRCAWLNHSSNAATFIDLVSKYPNIKLWFSGHFHLSQSYPDSISVVGSTAFVLTGVIGDYNRDGHRHSRVLKGDSEGYKVFTMDHDNGELRLDISGGWTDAAAPTVVTAVEELLCDPSDRWLCSKIDCVIEDVENSDGEDAESAISASTPAPRSYKWYSAGRACMLSLQNDIVVEYDIKTMAPVGAVAMNLAPGTNMRLVDGQGREVDAINTDGSVAVAVELTHPQTGEVQRIERNMYGTFFTIFQPNKWVMKKQQQKEEEERLANLRFTVSM